MFGATVTDVIDGDTFDISPGWRWNGVSGSRIRIASYDAAEIGTPAGLVEKVRLARLVLNQVVVIGSAYRIDRGRLVCEVFLAGRNIIDYLESPMARLLRGSQS